MNAITEKRGTVSVTLQPLNQQTAVALANNVYVKDGTKSVQDVLDNIPNIDNDLLYANNVLTSRLYNCNVYDDLKTQNGNKTLYTYDLISKKILGIDKETTAGTTVSGLYIITNQKNYKYYNGLDTSSFNGNTKDTIIFDNFISPNNIALCINNIPHAIISDCMVRICADVNKYSILHRIFESATIKLPEYSKQAQLVLDGIPTTNARIRINNAYTLYCNFALLGSTQDYQIGATDLYECSNLHIVSLSYVTHSTQLSIYPQIILACSFNQTDFSGSILTCNINDMFDKFYELFIGPAEGPETIIVNAIKSISSVVAIYISSKETKTLTLTNFDFANVSTAYLNIPAVTVFPKLTNIHCNINLTASTVMTDFALLSELGSDVQSIVTLSLSNACKTYITEVQLTELAQKGWTVTFN